jgi:YtfJ family uncharacterized protein
VRNPVVSILLILALVAAATGHAAAIRVGEKLPPLRITEAGECVLNGDETAFEPWQSSRLLGRVHVIEYLAARAGVDKLQQPLYAAIEAAGLPREQFATARVVNANDALFGTSGLVAPEVRKSKQQLPQEILVVDANGTGRKQWALQPKNSAIAIVDPTGTVLFFKEGALSADEIDAAIALIRRHLP